ncbi:MAG: DnaD domain protein [Lachnospiraceae bacterium]
MKKISMSFMHTPGVTCLPNTFIDVDMLQSNELQLKVYLYLLRNISSFDTIDISVMADHFNETEKDIERAIHFWEKKGTFKTEVIEKPVTTPLEIKQSISRDEKSKCLEQESFRELLFLAETYLGKPLSTSDITSLQFIKETLHFSDELLAFLLEYCADRKKKSFHYIETVARAWAEEHISTVAEAKANSSRYAQRVYSVLNALGIKEDPLSTHLEYIENWYENYGFELDVVLEACKRSVLSTPAIAKNRFSYAEKILANWHSLGVHHFSDIAQKDADYEKSKTTTKSKDKTGVPAYVANNPFLQYNQRNTDYDSLMQQLM